MKKCIDFISINGEDEIKEIKQNIEDGKFKFDKEGKYFIYFKIIVIDICPKPMFLYF